MWLHCTTARVTLGEPPLRWVQVSLQSQHRWKWASLEPHHSPVKVAAAHLATSPSIARRLGLAAVLLTSHGATCPDCVGQAARCGSGGTCTSRQQRRVCGTLRERKHSTGPHTRAWNLPCRCTTPDSGVAGTEAACKQKQQALSPAMAAHGTHHKRRKLLLSRLVRAWQ